MLASLGQFIIIIIIIIITIITIIIIIIIIICKSDGAIKRDVNLALVLFYVSCS
jgi:hypothetical protein